MYDIGSTNKSELKTFFESVKTCNRSKMNFSSTLPRKGVINLTWQDVATGRNNIYAYIYSALS